MLRLLKNVAKDIIGTLELYKFKFGNIGKEKFVCPICLYKGPFIDVKHVIGFRKHAKCPKCSSLERHRIQKLVLDGLSKDVNFSQMKILHIAPEPFFTKYFRENFKDYIAADMFMNNVNIKVDLTNISFRDEVFDFVFASHVLEHIQNDMIAISEIRRVLKPNGIAILHVPITAEKTIEYNRSLEGEHVRASGGDYYDRYLKYFSKIKKMSSDDFDPIYQPYVFDRRDHWPTEEAPLLKPMYGDKHVAIIPICFV